MKLQVYLFGSPRAFGGDTPLKLPPRSKVVSLWGYLLLHSGERIPRSHIAYTLWPDSSEQEARANLRRHLHRLGQILPEAKTDAPWIVTEGETLTWDPHGQCWLDVREFSRFAQAEDGLEQAVRLYTGDLLESVYDDWVISERERLRQVVIDALTRLVLRCRREAQLEQAIAYAGRLVQLEPLREDFLRLLMSLRYQVGDRAGALQEHGRFAARLLQDLGTDPMPETVMLYQAILRNAPLPTGEDPASSAPVKPTKTASRAGQSADLLSLPFVGRERELAQLTATWDRAARGSGTIFLLGGEAGVGKSRLVAELAFQAERQGGRVLFGKTSEAESIPFQAMIGALRLALPILLDQDRAPLRLAVLAQLLPELRDQADLPAELPRLDPDRERTRLFQIIASCLETLARSRPLVLVLEDLHHSGAATFELLDYLAQRVAALPILIVITYREEDVGRGHPLRSFRRQPRGELRPQHLALSRLSPSAVEDLITRLPGLEAISGPLAQRLHAESEGNPLFLVERLRDLIRSGSIQIVDGQWSLTRFQTEAPPPSIEDAIEARLQRLDTQSRGLLDLAAVMGTTFDLDVIREVSGWAEASQDAALQQLLHQQLVRDEAGSGTAEYVFTHHLIQEVTYRRMADAPRKRRHLQIAQVLRETSGEKPGSAAVLAHHFAAGGETGMAGTYYLKSAANALGVHADGDAARLAQLGLACNPEPATRLEFELLLEAIYSRRGSRDEQRAALTRLESIIEAADAPTRACEVIRRRILFHRAIGERQEERRWIAQLKSTAEALADPYWRAQADQAEGAHQLLLGQYPDASNALDQAMAGYLTLGDTKGQVECLCLLAEGQVQTGKILEVRPILDQARQLAATTGDQGLVVQALRAASAAAFVQQDFLTSLRLGKDMLHLCEAIGDFEGIADAHLRLGTCHARLFHVQEARRHYEQADDGYALVSRPQGIGAVAINAGFLANWLGHYDEARRLFSQAQSTFRRLEDKRGLAISTLNLGMVAYYQEDHRAAQEAAQAALELSREMGAEALTASALANLGAAERGLGELQAALGHMQAGLQVRRKIGQPADLANDLTDLTSTYVLAGDLELARRTMEELLDIQKAHPEAMMHPQYILWVAAQVRAASGRVDEAEENLMSALSALEDRASSIPDLESRAAYLDLPFNRQILQSRTSQP